MATGILVSGRETCTSKEKFKQIQLLQKGSVAKVLRHLNGVLKVTSIKVKKVRALVCYVKIRSLEGKNYIVSSCPWRGELKTMASPSISIL